VELEATTNREKWLSTLALIAAGHFLGYLIVHIPGRIEFLILLGIILLYPLLRMPVIGLYVLFIALPFIPLLRRYYYLVYDRPGLDPLVAIGELILLLLLPAHLFSLRESSSHSGERTMKIQLIVAVYFGYMILRSFFANSLPLTESLAKLKLYGPMVLLFYIGLFYGLSIRHLRRIWIVTIIIGVFASIYGFLQLYGGYSTAEKAWFNSIQFTTLFIEGRARPFSTFQAPVAFADYVQLSIIGVFILTGAYPNKKVRWIWVLVPLFFGAALITSVRSSWAGILTTFALTPLLYRVKGNRKRIFATVSLVLAYALYGFLSSTVFAGFGLSEFFTLFSRILPNEQFVDMLITQRTEALERPLGEYSLLSRFVLWRYILDTSFQPLNFLLGRGLGALKADSLYFTYLAEFGYPGLFLIIGFFFYFVKTGFFVVDRSPDPTHVVLARGITVMNLVFAVVSITGTHIHYFPGDVYFWFWNGVLVKLRMHTTDAKSAEGKR
jgi:hypothetical protein